MSTKDILDLIVIPVAIVLLPLIWGLTVACIRRIQFQNLIFREIEEIGPHPPYEAEKRKYKWTEYHSNKSEGFIHRKIFSDPTNNREFILSINPNLVYYVTQLWASTKDPGQWLYMISQIEAVAPFYQIKRRHKIRDVRVKWYELMKEYGVPSDENFIKNDLGNYEEELKLFKIRESKRKEKRERRDAQRK